jgi:hypothetical protein
MIGLLRAALVVALTGSLCSQALADASLSGLPGVGTSQKYAASETAGMSQSGMLTVARVTVDSVHITASDGLPALDQSLSVNQHGSMAQPSPASPFIDLLNYVATILAAAPPNLQKGAQWDATLSATTPLDTAAQSLAAGSPYAPKTKMKSVDVPITIATKLVSVSGDTLTFHGEGVMKQYTATVGGNMGETITTTIDFVLKSGVLQSASRTTIAGFGPEGNPMNMSYVTALTAK